MSERELRWALLPAGLFLLVTGVLALIAPDTFFDEIGNYGVENSHYVGDVGAFQTAAGLGVLVAIWRPAWRAPPLNHLFDIGEARSDARGWVDTLLLALAGAASAYLAVASERLRRNEETARER